MVVVSGWRTNSLCFIHGQILLKSFVSLGKLQRWDFPGVDISERQKTGNLLLAFSDWDFGPWASEMLLLLDICGHLFFIVFTKQWPIWEFPGFIRGAKVCEPTIGLFGLRFRSLGVWNAATSGHLSTSLLSKGFLLFPEGQTTLWPIYTQLGFLLWTFTIVP